MTFHFHLCVHANEGGSEFVEIAKRFFANVAAIEVEVDVVDRADCLSLDRFAASHHVDNIVESAAICSGKSVGDAVSGIGPDGFFFDKHRDWRATLLSPRLYRNAEREAKLKPGELARAIDDVFAEEAIIDCGFAVFLGTAVGIGEAVVVGHFKSHVCLAVIHKREVVFHSGTDCEGEMSSCYVVACCIDLVACFSAI